MRRTVLALVCSLTLSACVVPPPRSASSSSEVLPVHAPSASTARPATSVVASLRVGRCDFI
jgi:hypothetical protein